LSKVLGISKVERVIFSFNYLSGNSCSGDGSF